MVQDSRSLTIHQDLSKRGVAGVVWDCTYELLEFMKHVDLAGQDVLELGAGTGALGLALACSQKLNSLMLTDMEQVIPLCERNLEAALSHNDVRELLERKGVACQTLLWGDPSPFRQAFDVILCSDCLYDASLHEKLLETLLQLTQDTFSTIFIAYKRRLPHKEHTFFLQAQVYFTIQVHSPTQQALHLSPKDIYILHLQRHKYD